MLLAVAGLQPRKNSRWKARYSTGQWATTRAEDTFGSQRAEQGAPPQCTYKVATNVKKSSANFLKHWNPGQLHVLLASVMKEPPVLQAKGEELHNCTFGGC